MNRRMRAAATVILVATTILGLGACVGIPTSGPVMPGRDVSEQVPSGSEFIPEGPVAGAEQEAILRGFIEAYKGLGNYDVARQFLSDEFAEEWDPRESVLVRTGSTHFDRVNDVTMNYGFVMSATVDRDGEYFSFPSSAQSLTYGFVKENGEWRISEAPNGIVLLDDTFRALFLDRAIYFLDPTRQNLVPDLRWFPAGTAVSRIVTALLNGPPEWLEGAVSTAFPEGTRLSSPRAVEVDRNVVVVDLSSEALAASESQRQLMRTQLQASLGKVVTLPNVQLWVEGAQLSIAPPGEDAPAVRPQVDSRMLVLRDGEFGYLANDRITPLNGLSDKVVATNPVDATLGATGTTVATLTAKGVYLVRSSVDEPTLVDPRPGLIAPALDSYGYLWTVQRSDPTSIRAYDMEGNAFAVATTLPRGADIVSLVISRDGARVAALLATDAGPRLIVAAIIRDQNRNQAPLSFGEPKLDVVTDSGTAIDATWVDELRVATLSRVGAAYSVTSHQIGGRTSSLGSPGEAVAIVGGNGENGLRVMGADGIISVRRGSGWQGGPQATFLATQR